MIALENEVLLAAEEWANAWPWRRRKAATRLYNAVQALAAERNLRRPH